MSLRSFIIDFNSYFASVEQQLNPRLRGKPVGVVPVMAETTSCIAASYEAKHFGVKTGTSVRDARKLCPGIVFIEAQHAVYVHYHQLAVAAVDRIVPVRQVMSIDEMECELPTRWRSREKVTQLAQAVKKEILSTVGDQLHTSIGVAPNTLLGKLASNMQKPNGLVILEMADIPRAFLHLKLQAINGIGANMLVRLNRCGIHSLEQLYAAPRDLLHTVWGGVAGDEMYDKLRGQWYAPRATVERSLGHSHVLPPDLRNPVSAFAVLNRLTQKAAMRLRKQQLYATAMQVSVRCRRYGNDASPGSQGSQGVEPESIGGHRATHFGETQNTSFLLHTLQTLWQTGLHNIRLPHGVGVVLLDLVPAALHTPCLFEDATAREQSAVAQASKSAIQNAPAQRSPVRLLATMDAINKIHGKTALYFATAHHALDHAPMRIAFNRIPDLETER